jgi:integrase
MADVEAVLKAMKAKSDLDSWTMLTCYLHTAARRSELFNAKWKDVDFQSSTITLWTRKRKSGSWEPDVIPMTQTLRNALLQHRGKYGQYEHIFTWQGKPYKSKRHWLEYWCAEAGVKKFSFHSIRHLTASWLDSKGVPLRTIQAILRHKAATTTNRYLHELRGVQVDLDSVFEVEEKEGKVISLNKK